MLSAFLLEPSVGPTRDEFEAEARERQAQAVSSKSTAQIRAQLRCGAHAEAFEVFLSEVLFTIVQLEGGWVGRDGYWRYPQVSCTV